MGCACSNRSSFMTSDKKSGKTLKNEVDKYSKKSNLRKDFEFISNLGNGSFGKVRLFRSILSKELKYAVKTIKKENMNKVLYNCIKGEVDILRKLDHPSIVKYYETFEDQVYIHIVMEYLSGDNLSKVISLKKHNKFVEKDMSMIFRQLLKALCFIHNRNIVHRDIKPENILFSQKDDFSTLKLIDFGLATSTMAKDRKSCGSPYYMSPEIIDGKFSPKSDLWSVGVIIYMMICGKVPFGGNNMNEVLDKIQFKKFDKKLLVKAKASEEVIDLITKLLDKDPDKRPTAIEALEHPWFRKYIVPFNGTAMSDDIIKALKDFAMKTTFQKEILFFIAKLTTDDEIKKLREIFELLDIKNTGTLTFEEIQIGLKKINHPITDQELEEIWHGLDFHQDGEINYTEFLAAMISSVKAQRDEKLLTSFKFFECEDEGLISYNSLTKAIEAFGLSINETEIQKTFDSFKTKDKKINFESFKKLIDDGNDTILSTI